MHKIENEIVKAIAEHKTVKLSSRDYVETVGNVSSIFLHGNKIATVESCCDVVFSFCGWETNTTKSRINAIIDYFAEVPGYVRTRNYELQYCIKDRVIEKIDGNASYFVKSTGIIRL